MPTQKDRFKRVKISEVLEPKDGYTAIVGWYWVVVDGCVLFYDGMHPQRNKIESIAKRLSSNMFPDAKIMYIPVAYERPEADGGY